MSLSDFLTACLSATIVVAILREEHWRRKYARLHLEASLWKDAARYWQLREGPGRTLFRKLYGRQTLDEFSERYRAETPILVTSQRLKLQEESNGEAN